MDFDLTAYLARLELPNPGSGREGLFRLHRAHMTHVPFENTEPLLGRVPSLAPDDLFDKMVTRRRGGYCFEHNGLYAGALRALGYDITPLLGRVRNGAPEGGARTHQAHLVDIDGETWLTDVGFGGHSPLVPLALRFDVEHDAFLAVVALTADMDDLALETGVGDIAPGPGSVAQQGPGVL